MNGITILLVAATFIGIVFLLINAFSYMTGRGLFAFVFAAMFFFVVVSLGTYLVGQWLRLHTPIGSDTWSRN